MGKCQYHRSGWELWLGENITSSCHCSIFESTLGCHHVYGVLNMLRKHVSWPRTNRDQDSFYKPLTPEQSAKAFRNEFDFDSPDAIDFEVLVEKLKDIKQGYESRSPHLVHDWPKHSKVAEIPVYSFEKHSRLEKTTTVYSPHVLILEGIFALHDPRVLDLLDLKVSSQRSGLDHV